MPRTLRSAVLQGSLFVLSTLLAFAILVRTDIVRRLAYLVEKGRIEALRESLPEADELARRDADARAVAAAVTPAVVQIVAEKRIAMADLLRMHALDGADTDSNGGLPDDALTELLRQHAGVQTRSGYGSGFIVDAERGHVITNDHVIADADTLQVHLADGRRLEARVLGRDPRSDLALLAIEADNLHELPLVSHDLVEVGDAVLSVGNPFGLEGTVSRGIVSAKSRSNINIHGTEYKGFLQTDAVINPGNSGGPLVNLRGEVVAINTAIATETGHYDGVGFAIPARRIRQVLPALERGEPVPRGYLGVSIVDAVTVLGDDARGVYVRAVVPDSPAERVDLRAGDVILAIDGRRLRGTADLIDWVGDSAPGTELALTVVRAEQETTVRVRVAGQPEGFTTRVRRNE